MKDFYCEQILSGKTKVEIVFETSKVMAFHHTNPYWEAHVVIIPKVHIESLSEYPNGAPLNQDFFAAMKLVARMIENEYGGCRISSNVGSYQSTNHLHWYVYSGKRLRAENGDRMVI